jgi:hypothetical protein
MYSCYVKITGLWCNALFQLLGFSCVVYWTVPLFWHTLHSPSSEWISQQKDGAQCMVFQADVKMRAWCCPAGKFSYSHCVRLTFLAVSTSHWIVPCFVRPTYWARSSWLISLKKSNCIVCWNIFSSVLTWKGTTSSHVKRLNRCQVCFVAPVVLCSQC